MKNEDRKNRAAHTATAVIMIIAILIVLAAVIIQRGGWTGGSTEEPANIPGHDWNATVIDRDFPENWDTGYLAGLTGEIEVFDENGAALCTLARGTEVKYALSESGQMRIAAGDVMGFVLENQVARDVTEVIPVHTEYVRTALNFRNADGSLMETLADKGSTLEVTGYDRLNPNGSAHMYKVSSGETEGYIPPEYLTDTYEEAIKNYDQDGTYQTHLGRGDSYGGGSADNLDYFPREKGSFENNVMPEECRTLYVCAWRVDEIDEYIRIADSCGINAFVVDITDGTSVGYAGEVMKKYAPTAAANASNTVEEYQAAIKKLKDAGYYVIGRITTFNDSFFVSDHPECAVKDNNGQPLALSGVYWPTPYNRYAWQYKVDLAVEAAQLMGFNEIQFDYVRFPDLTYKYEKEGTIDYVNSYGETKAQAIQRFLMYASDILHENGVYISADVFGESAYTYVTAYGQYWPAVSNVVDVISGMPYPDHFGYTDTWRPWEHPYETLYSWGQSVAARQSETTSPAIVRTWIQAYNAIREPYNEYGVAELEAQIDGLRDAGITGGYMTWNGGSSIDKYSSLTEAFSH